MVTTSAVGSRSASAVPGTPVAEGYRWNLLPLGQRVAIFGGWTVLGLIETVRVARNPTSIGVPSIPWTYAFLGNFPWWFAWALLTPLVFWFANRFRVGSDNWIARLPLQIGSGLLVIALHLPMALVIWFYTNPLPQVRSAGFWGSLVRTAMGPFLLLELLAVAATVGLFYALDNHRRLHQHELQTAHLVARAAAAETAAAEARLDALRLELSPHFLFNSLNAISGLIRSNEPTTAIEVLARLGDLLRISLSKDRAPQTLLALELQHLELYLDIERQRFRDRLQIIIDVDTETLQCLVPVLVLQPLVENAIKHGVSKRPGAATVSVSGSHDVTRAQLVLTIQDDGPGFSRQSLEPTGIGLKNTRARLFQLYGEAGELVIATPKDGGAMVTVRIPFVLHTAGTAALPQAVA